MRNPAHALSAPQLFLCNNVSFAFLKENRMQNDGSFNIRDLHQVRKCRRTPPSDAKGVDYTVCRWHRTRIVLVEDHRRARG